MRLVGDLRLPTTTVIVNSVLLLPRRDFFSKGPDVHFFRNLLHVAAKAIKIAELKDKSPERER